MFEKRFQELDVTLKSYETLNQKLQEEYHDLQERTKTFESDRNQFTEVNPIVQDRQHYLHFPGRVIIFLFLITIGAT